VAVGTVFIAGLRVFARQPVEIAAGGMAAAVFGENAMRIVMASQAGGAGVAAEQPQGRRGGILADGAMTPPAVITASPMEGVCV